MNHGQNHRSYADQFSLVLHGYIYIICFSTFFAYITLSMLLADFSIFIQFAMVGSVCVQFCVVSYIQQKQLTIQSMNYFDYPQRQNEWKNQKVCCTYLCTFFMLIFINDIILSEWLVFILFTPIWIIQIMTNAYGNFKKTPNILYAMSLATYMLFMPIYLRAFPNNFLFIKPNYIFSFAVVVFTVI